MLSTFKIETFEDLLKALREKPEWREELRRLILTEELLSLPQKFEIFVHQEFRPLKVKVDKIDQDVGGLKQDVAVLKEDVAAVLKQDVAILKQDVAELKGEIFERRVRERAPAYFGRLIRRCRVISFEELADALDDAIDRGVISESQKQDVLNIDVVTKEILKTDSEKQVIIAGEVSIKVDRVDVERAHERAKILERAFGMPAISVVIGRESTEGAKTKADELDVILI
jgi:hypothetical protein